MEKGTMSFTTGEGLGIIQFGNPSELFSDKAFEVVFYLAATDELSGNS